MEADFTLLKYLKKAKDWFCNTPSIKCVEEDLQTLTVTQVCTQLNHFETLNNRMQQFESYDLKWHGCGVVNSHHLEDQQTISFCPLLLLYWFLTGSFNAHYKKQKKHIWLKLQMFLFLLDVFQSPLEFVSGNALDFKWLFIELIIF